MGSRVSGRTAGQRASERSARAHRDVAVGVGVGGLVLSSVVGLQSRALKRLMAAQVPGTAAARWLKTLIAR